MASSRHPLSIFPDLNNTPTEITDIGFSEPLQSAPASSFNFPTMSVEQLMATKSNIDTNSHTLNSCIEVVTAVSILSHRLQSRTNEVQWLSAKLSLYQRMYQDTRIEIDQLKRQTKELKQEQEPWLGQCSYGVPVRWPKGSDFLQKSYEC
ncbi:hypothetical protein ACSBR2_007663 [Camellia fascicularis]